jgi:CubicO group peptidase (beta-lactamase class C family)
MFEKMKIHTLTALLTIGLSVVSNAQTPDASQLRDLESTIYNDMRVSGAPGAVVGVVKEGRLVYHKAFGISNTHTGAAVDTAAVFHIASLTKIFTAAALLTVCERKNIDLNAPIGNILTELSPGLSRVTIHQLLSQNSGIIDMWTNTNECKDDMLEYFVKAGDNAFFADPGTVFSYSNNGFALAGLVLARLNNTTYQKAVTDLLIKPLRMSRTTFDLREVITSHFATGHWDGKPVAPLLAATRLSAAGGLFSNVPDLARFATCLMNEGQFESRQVISREVVRKMTGKYHLLDLQHQYLTYPDSYYGYGLINFPYGGVQFMGHSGEAVSQNALLAMAPDHQTAILVMSNTGYYPFIQTLEKAMELFIPLQEEKKIPPVSMHTDISRFMGRYYEGSLSKKKTEWIELEIKDHKPYITFPDNQSYPLTRYADNKFRYSDPAFKFPLEIRITPDEAGTLKYLNFFWRTYVRE